MTRTLRAPRPSLVAALAASAFLVGQACGGDDDPRGLDAAVSADGGRDAGMASPDADTPLDAGPADAGATDASVDGGPVGDGGPSFACTLEELTPIAECAAAACVSLPEGGIPADASLPDPGELATCILTSCGTLLLGVSPDCRDCLIAGVGMNVDEITMRCADGIPTP